MIGGGAAGAALALFLARRGVSVTLVDDGVEPVGVAVGASELTAAIGAHELSDWAYQVSMCSQVC